jgi:hypothetical protein
MTTTTEPLQVKWKLFVPWLESQPKDRSFEYTDIHNCLICNFIAETHSAKISAGSNSITVPESGQVLVIPEEIVTALFEGRCDLLDAGWEIGPITIGCVLARLKPPA